VRDIPASNTIVTKAKLGIIIIFCTINIRGYELSVNQKALVDLRTIIFTTKSQEGCDYAKSVEWLVFEVKNNNYKNSIRLKILFLLDRRQNTRKDLNIVNLFNVKGRFSESNENGIRL